MTLFGPPGDPRVLTPDIYPRDYDPLRPPANGYESELERGIRSSGGPVGSFESEMSQFSGRVGFGSRAVTYRRFITYQITAGTNPTPLLNQVSAVETIVLQVPGTSSVPAFVGAQNVNTVSGIRLNGGQGVVISESNSRRETEILQRQDEQTALLSLIARADFMPPPIDSIPVTVLNPNDFYVVAAVNRAVNVWLFYLPERL